MAKTVVILGGSYAGLAVAHQLLQKTLPLVPELKVILVSTSSHLFWNVASPRAIIPKQLPDEQVFQPIEPAFAKYPSGSFEFIVGAAKNVEPTTNTVQVSTKEGEKALSYDALVVTTGAGAIGGAPWKLLGSYEETVAVLHETQEKVQKAQSIVVGGGGVTGVETAGELGYEYGTTKEITLISKDNGVVANFPNTKVQTGSLDYLKKLHVKVVTNTTVDSVQTLENGQTALTLSNGSTLTVDLYIPSVGLTPNSSFMPTQYLNAHSEITVEPSLRVKATQNIYSCGDVADIQSNRLMYIAGQASALAANVQAAFLSKELKAYKPAFTDDKPVGIVTVGRDKGFGAYGTWSIPGFVAYYAKVKTMMTEKMAKAVQGSM